MDALIAAVAAVRQATQERDDAVELERRTKLADERNELQARQSLSVIQSSIRKRVKDLELEAALGECWDATSTQGITRAAGDFHGRYLQQAPYGRDQRARSLLSETND